MKTQDEIQEHYELLKSQCDEALADASMALTLHATVSFLQEVKELMAAIRSIEFVLETKSPYKPGIILMQVEK